MSIMITDSQNYSDIADAIRGKNGTQNTYKPGQMADAIDNLPSGGSDTFTEAFEGTLESWTYNGAKTSLKTYDFAGPCPKIMNLPGITQLYTSDVFVGSNAQVVNLPDVTQIESSGFGFNNIREIYLPKYALDNTNKARQFQTSSSLEKITVLKLTVVPTHCFSGNSNLKDIITLTTDKITSVSSYGFYNCSALPSIDLSSCATIQDSAFGGCSSLASVDLSSTTTIGSTAFENCNSLSSVSEVTATTLGYSAFRNTKITELKLPNITTLTSPGYQISGNSYIKTLDLCKNNSALTTIPKLQQPANYGPDPLTNFDTLIIRRTDEIVNLSAAPDTAFRTSKLASSTKSGHVYVPSALLSTYQAATNWSAIATLFRALEDYTVDGTVTGDLDPNKI